MRVCSARPKHRRDASCCYQRQTWLGQVVPSRRLASCCYQHGRLARRPRSKPRQRRDSPVAAASPPRCVARSLWKILSAGGPTIFHNDRRGPRVLLLSLCADVDRYRGRAATGDAEGAADLLLVCAVLARCRIAWVGLVGVAVSPRPWRSGPHPCPVSRRCRTGNAIPRGIKSGLT